MRFIIGIIFAVFLTASSLAHAENKLKVIASFSIIGDMAHEVGGDNIELKILVPAGGNMHEYQPTPADVRNIKTADLLIINGMEFEGSLQRLTKSANYKNEIVTASDGINKIEGDPHAWQDIENAKIYVKNIRDALIRADRNNAQKYQNNAENYLQKLDEVEKFAEKEISKIPEEKRNVATTHDAFAYFARAYDINFISLVGTNSQAQASAKDMAKLVDKIREKQITAVFLENMSDQRLMKRLEKDTGVRTGGTLYTDSLSPESGNAPTYISMFLHNITEITKSLH